MAVYTALTAADIAAHLTQYTLGGLQSHAGISEGVENTNYKIETDQGPFILTLFEKRVDSEALPFYLGFMAALLRDGLPTAEVMKTTTGEAAAVLAGKTALITRFLPGTATRQPTVAQTAAIGTLLARMHLIGQKMKQTRVNAMSLPAWISLIHACGPRADDVQAGLEGELELALSRLHTDIPRDLPQGVIHADLFPDNVFFSDADGQLSGIIDFYFACRDVLAYDLMLTLNAWCFTPLGDIDGPRAAALLSAYQAVRPLSDAEKTALPYYGMAAAMRIIATRLYDYLHPVDGALVRPKDPLEHLRILRYHRSIDAAGAGFVAGLDTPI